MGRLGRRSRQEPTRVALETTETGPRGETHRHVAIFDARGNGRTTRAADGHWHGVRLLEVEPAGGHTHELTATRAPLDEEEAQQFENQIAARVTA